MAWFNQRWREFVPLLRAFRLSVYLTLALACLCLGYAEGDLLPESPYITALAIVLIAVAHRVEGRWSLSLQSANSVGAVLAAALIGWIGFQFVRGPVGVLDLLPFPANLLPYLGPILMILAPAKLFRPKHIGDFWAIQGVGLLAVTLGCAMANDFFFTALLVLYVLSFAWGLTLFYLYREARIENDPPDAPASAFYLLRSASAWTFAAVAVGLVAFLATPRFSQHRWELSLAAHGRLETGLSENAVDLNHTGSVQQNSDVVFEVVAEDGAGRPRLDLSLDQRWRAASLTHYEAGRWSRDRNPGLFLVEKSRRNFGDLDLREGRNGRLPDFGPNSYYLSYILENPSGNLNILADPVYWRPGVAPPIFVYNRRFACVQQHQDGQFEWLSVPGAGRESYCQVVAPLPADRGVPMRVANGYEDFLTLAPSAGMKDRVRRWTEGVLERLVGEHKLQAAALQEVDANRLPLEKHHEAIARALEAHLAGSGEFVYTLDLTRKDKNVDPVEDFLFTTRAGHCQRFATALAMMLRSLGIPAQLVIGYRGCEALGDGHYVVRQSQAHAWVEALVPALDAPPARADDPAGPQVKSVQWLSLDPTPSGGPVAAADQSFGAALANALAWAEMTFREAIMGNDSLIGERQFEAISDRLDDFGAALLAPKFNSAKAGSAFATLAAAGLVVFRLRRRRSRRTGDADASRLAPFYARFVRLLARQGRSPKMGQTPREFAAEISEALRTRSKSEADAGAPLLLTDAYYRVRFGGQEITPDEQRSLDAAVDRLQTALAPA
jgi:protein-glutamine gamma-glutamyltransferase